MTAEAYPATSLNSLEGQQAESSSKTRYISIFGEKAASASGLVPALHNQSADVNGTPRPSIIVALDTEPKKLSRFQKYTSTLFGEDAAAVLGEGNDQSRQAVIEAMTVLFYRNKKNVPSEKTLLSFRISFSGFFDGLSNQQIVDQLREYGINKAPSSLAPFFSIAKSSIKDNVRPEDAFEVLLNSLRAPSTPLQEVTTSNANDEWLEPTDDDIQATGDVSTELKDAEIEKLAQSSEREARRVSLPRATGRVAVNGGVAANLRNPRPLLDLTPRDGKLTDNFTDENEGTWQEKALCAQTDPEAFFPEKGGSTREAKRICLGCEVKDACLNYALSKDERFGIWGGLSERERRRLKRDS